MMIHVFGAVGMLLVLSAYGLVSAKRLLPSGIAYQGMNFGGAVILVIYSIVLVAWVSVALNVVWAAIAVVTLIRNRMAPAEGSAGSA